MIAVADTSPLCYLVLIDEIDLLQALFSEVVVPPAVAAELSDPRAPAPVSAWWKEPPEWMRVEAPRPHAMPDVLERLHQAEREAILLTRDLDADVVILDEKAARQAAKSLELPVIGLIGILATAAEQGRVDLLQAVERLRATNFRVSPALIRDLLKRFG